MKFKVGQYIKLKEDISRFDDGSYTDLINEYCKIKKIVKCSQSQRSSFRCESTCRYAVVFEESETEWCDVFENFERTIPITKPKKFSLYDKV